MSEHILEIKGLSAGIGEEQILNNVDLSIRPGETHVLMGPNGAGKSTLGNVIMGSPVYQVNGGTILFDGEDITGESVDSRAKRGIFLSFQNPLEVPGLSLEAFLRSAIRERSGKPVKVFAFKKKIEETCRLLDMDPAYVERDLNVGFSGGEKKKAEIFQLLILEPKLAILDETDSGLDVDAVRVVSKGIDIFKKNGGSLLIITHSTRILDNLSVDQTHILVDGHIVKSGDASLVDRINSGGYSEYTKAEG
ncbi:MAG: Fe-S cluster assembly ATPase SufC [Lachnospiraceae bacterium]|nr:Fe-S cluster assembly ATPase SufC [Lachnospiraceae bacterium]